MLQIVNAWFVTKVGAAARCAESGSTPAGSAEEVRRLSEAYWLKQIVPSSVSWLSPSPLKLTALGFDRKRGTLHKIPQFPG